VLPSCQRFPRSPKMTLTTGPRPTA
jgi:hypothetical protein